MTETIAIPVPESYAEAEPASAVGEMSQWHLIWLRFRRNKLAMAGLVVLAIMYCDGGLCRLSGA